MRKHKVTTDSDHKFNIAPNLLNRNFVVDHPNKKRAVDISYVWPCEGWLYLAVVLDLHSKRVIGWAVSNRMYRDLAIRALDMAIALRCHQKAASIIRIAAANIACMIARKFCASMAMK